MAISIYEFRDYRKYLRAWLEDPEKKRRGLQGSLAKAMQISSSLMSLILRGEKNLSAEQTVEAADFMTLRERETEYFLALVALGNAGSVKWRTRLETQLTRLQEEAQKVANRVVKDKEIPESALATYYASWIYSAVRSLTALPGKKSPHDLAERLKLPVTVISQVIEFLLQWGFCVESPQGLSFGPAHFHTGPESILALRHHQNWRHKAINSLDLKNKTDLFYTCAMVLSEDDAIKIRKDLISTIEKVLERARPSTSETVRCLNLDYFSY